MQNPVDDKTRLKRMREIASQLLAERPEYGFDPAKIQELHFLAARFDHMEIDRRMLMHHFERYERFKQADKRSEEYLQVRNHVGNLETAASVRTSDND